MRARALWLFPAVLILIASSPLQAMPVHQWSKGFGDANLQHGQSVATDGSGNVIVTGWFEGTVDFGGGPLTNAGIDGDIFVAKFDANGNHLWSQRFGDADGQYGNSVAADGSGNVVVTGEFYGTVDFGGGPLTSAGQFDIFVAKFDADGNHLWSQHFGDASSQYGYSVATDGSGNVVITGVLTGSMDFGGGPLTSAGQFDIFVAKFDADGNHLWSQRFGGTDHQQGYSVATDGSGNVIVTGLFGGTVDFGGGLLTSAGVADIFVARFDANGNHLWSQRFGDTGDQQGYSVAADGSGNVVITGLFGGTVDFGGGPLTSAGADIFVAQFDANGNHLWSQRFGDGNFQQGYSVAVDGSGNVVVTGFFYGTVDFGGGPLTSAAYTDIFVAKFDANGNHLWSQRFGDGNFQHGRSVAADGSGNIVITGVLTGTVDFGGGPLTSAGESDIFVAKFNEQSLPVLITSFEAKTREGLVEVTWGVWSDEALESYRLYRRDDARPLPIVIAEGPFDATTRSYVDAIVEPGKTYHYELFIHTQGGDDFRSPVATVTVPRFEATLGQNFPNPFKPATTIEYTLTERSNTVVGIYDATGRLVVRLEQGIRESGTHRAEWDGRDAGGSVVGSGVYFYRLEGAPGVMPKKMVRLK